MPSRGRTLWMIVRGLAIEDAYHVLGTRQAPVSVSNRDSYHRFVAFDIERRQLYPVECTTY